MVKWIVLWLVLVGTVVTVSDLAAEFGDLAADAADVEDATLVPSVGLAPPTRPCRLTHLEHVALADRSPAPPPHRPPIA